MNSFVVVAAEYTDDDIVADCVNTITEGNDSEIAGRVNGSLCTQIGPYSKSVLVYYRLSID